MDKNGTIIVIEDDPDDQFVLELVFAELNCPNKREYFSDGLAALEYLYTTADRLFIIISDINLPQLNGMEFRKIVQSDAETSLRCIPYVFLTTPINQKAVIDAYSDSVQGIFSKPSTFEEIKDTVKLIMEYWKKCSAPNDFTA